ncbi:hypothetical protein RDI58_013183 [Solanum bulbocastanum]|uniref:Uncharacterized protein n=1 Tax=Solanum bulbocastanum TaxID=147425 RepID=A0AAN8YDR9_SOLBU
MILPLVSYNIAILEWLHIGIRF